VSDSGRTHKPSPKRIRDFRKKGEVAQSRELTSAATLGMGLIGLFVLAGSSWSALCAVTATAARGESLTAIAGAARSAFTTATVPVIVAALLGCVLAGGLQLGWPPMWRWPTVDVTRVFKLGGAAKALSPKAMVGRLASALVRIAVIGAVVAVAALRELRAVAATDPHAIAPRLGRAVITLGLAGAAALIAIGAIDYLRSRRSLGEKMKMTTSELKQEHRESEGDPQVKGSRRRRMRELSKRRAVAATKTADVVLVNPTHYAVAIRYRAAEGGAPRVVAKGVDELALRMREAARAAGVPVIERPPLARALHKLVKEEQEIPSALYHAVAEVLAYVYRLRDRRRGSAS
jgi:flagellar biosynthetic protein FlhB